MTRASPGREPATVLVVGLGNIESQVVPLLPGMPGLEKVILVDSDRYEERNLDRQRISRRDLGRPKTAVQARALRALAPGLEVEAFHAPVETLPRGRLAATVIVAAVDSRAARQYLNELAWRAGRPWIDAAVDAAASLARVRCHDPATGDCLECAWDDEAYALLEQRYPCFGSTAPAATDAPVELGALAAACDLVDVTPLEADPAAGYIVELGCRGLVNEGGAVTEAARFAIGIRFPADYLRRVTDPGRLIAWLSPSTVWHPNIAPPFICLGKVPPGTGLVDLVYQVFEIVTYAKVTPREDDALNKVACAWARANQDRFPVDARPLKRPRGARAHPAEALRA